MSVSQSVTNITYRVSDDINVINVINVIHVINVINVMNVIHVINVINLIYAGPLLQTSFYSVSHLLLYYCLAGGSCQL